MIITPISPAREFQDICAAAIEGSAKVFNSFQIAQTQFELQLNTDSPTIRDNSTPVVVRTTSLLAIPVRMDDGSVKVFRGFACSTMMRVGREKVEFGSIPKRRSIPYGL